MAYAERRPAECWATAIVSIIQPAMVLAMIRRGNRKTILLRRMWPDASNEEGGL